MQSPALLPRLVLLAATLTPLTAWAHPGHDGDHDLVWDFGHLAAHPFATLGCALVLGTIAWIGWRALRTPPAPQAAPAKVARRNR